MRLKEKPTDRTRAQCFPAVPAGFSQPFRVGSRSRRSSTNPMGIGIFLILILMAPGMSGAAYAADFGEKLNGKWKGTTWEHVDAYGRSWYRPATVYEVRVVGSEIEMRIVAYPLKNLNREELYSPQDYVYFRGWIDGQNVKGTYYPWEHGGTATDRLRVTEPYKKSFRVLVSDDGNRMNWDDGDYTRSY